MYLIFRFSFRVKSNRKKSGSYIKLLDVGRDVILLEIFISRNMFNGISLKDQYEITAEWDELTW